MLNKLMKFIRQENLLEPGDRVICAVSGGADSIALLFGLYLLRQKLGITLEAAHFNHRLRGEESERDARFVGEFCRDYQIPLHMGSGDIVPGKKGLEAAARDARYGFLESLPGKIATAHTADDNAETLLMHLIRGTGLRGLGGISPVRGRIIRPMLLITRQEVEAFLEEWSLSHVEDATNQSDQFLRNRIRRKVMPLLRQENPRLAENLSQTALNLRQDSEFLESQAEWKTLPSVTQLRQMPKALRIRALGRFLKSCGVREPENVHLEMAEGLVFSRNPSAWANFPGGITIERRYGTLAVREREPLLGETILSCPGELEISGLRVICEPAREIRNGTDAFTVAPEGTIRIRSRREGDFIRLLGGTKSLKKLFIDRKIPAGLRGQIPVVLDDVGILGVYSIGVDFGRAAKSLPAVIIRFETRERREWKNGREYSENPVDTAADSDPDSGAGRDSDDGIRR